MDKILVQKEINAGGFLTRIFSLNIDGKKNLAIPREVQFDPLSDQPIHVDFLRLAPDSKITLDIPTHFINEETSPGIKRGGVLNVNRRTIQLSCPANNIPEEIVFDLDGLEIGDTIRISSVTLPEGVVPLITDRDFTVASVAAPTVVKEPETPVEGEDEGEGEGEGEGEASTEEGGDKKEDSEDSEKSDEKQEEKS